MSFEYFTPLSDEFTIIKANKTTIFRLYWAERNGIKSVQISNGQDKKTVYHNDDLVDTFQSITVFHVRIYYLYF